MHALSRVKPDSNVFTTPFVKYFFWPGTCPCVGPATIERVFVEKGGYGHKAYLCGGMVPMSPCPCCIYCGFGPCAAEWKFLKSPEDELAKEMTHDLEMNFNKIAPFGKEDTAKELQDHAAKTQDTLVDAVENAEVAEIKRAVFRALTRLRAAAIKEFDTIARLETQAIDAYNDAHHYRAENPLTHLHEDEAPVETDKLKSFH